MAVDYDDVDEVATAIADLYAEAELSLTRRIARQIEAGFDEPAHVRARLDDVGALRQAAHEVVDALRDAADVLLRRGAAAVYRNGWGDALEGLAPLVSDDPSLEERVRQARLRIPGIGAVEALAAGLVRDLRPVHDRIVRQAVDVYRAVTAAATGRVLLGVDTRRQASQAAWAGFVARGVSSFVDRSGRRWRLTSYVEMATRTTVARAAEQGHVDAIRALDLDLVYIGDLPMECPLCRPWEGKILALAGEAGRIQAPHAITGQPVAVDVAATLAQARAAGLHHPNCRHGLDAYLPGVTRVGPGKADPDGYEAKQRQRALERRIRAAKEQEAAALDDAARAAARRQVRARQADLRAHLAEHPDLLRRRHREQIGAGNVPPAHRLDDVAGAIEMRGPEPVQKPAPLVGDAAMDSVPKGLYKPGTLTPEQEKDLRFYETSMFREINGGLRGGSPNSLVQRVAATIDSALEDSVLPHDIQAWRGMYGARQLFQDSLDGDLAGFTWKELGYSSTTTQESVAHAFMVLDGPYAEDPRFKGQNVKVRVTVPAGTKAVQISSSTQGSTANGPQAEVLLQRGVTWRIVKDHGWHPDGYRLLEAEVTPESPKLDPLANVDLARLPTASLFALWHEHPDDVGVYERVAAELDRRDRERDQLVDDVEPDVAPAEDAAEALAEIERSQRIDDLVAQGWDWLEAYAEVVGADPEDLRRQERASLVDEQRAAGETREQTVRRLYREWVYQRYLDAETATRGHLLNRRGAARGVDPASLFSGPAHVARAYASEDLLRWWAEHGRMTYTEFRAQVLASDSDRQAAERIRLRGNDRDFGV